MAAMFHISFRFSQSQLAQLDKVVKWEQSKGPMLLPHLGPTRTSVLKALVAREILRLEHEAEKVQATLERANQSFATRPDQIPDEPETPLQRKSRLQRQRRASKRQQVA